MSIVTLVSGGIDSSLMALLARRRASSSTLCLSIMDSSDERRN